MTFQKATDVERSSHGGDISADFYGGAENVQSLKTHQEIPTVVVSKKLLHSKEMTYGRLVNGLRVRTGA